MNSNRLRYLIDVNKTKKATLEEKEELDFWYNSFNNNSDVTDSLDEGQQETIRFRIWNHLIDNPKLSFLNKPAKQIKLFNTVLFRAAIVTIIFGLGIYFYIQRETKQAVPNQELAEVIDIRPGGNNATLTLADGSIIDLQEIADGNVIAQSGLSIIKTEEGTITYKADSINLNNTSEITYNTINTPRGGQYKVILPDGSLVWLNASSSLTYPTKFGTTERLIELSGEAYFEVSHQYSDKNKKIPFVVKTTNQVIEVLGTHFNVKAYEDERETATTLLEGKVKVIGFENGVETNKERILNIGETALWNNTSFIVKKANLEKAVAWKNGKFIFTGENLTQIMKDISRWYDVDVVYKGNLSNINFEGSLSRYENISEILHKLELTGVVQFKIVSGSADQKKGRRIEVMQ